MQPTLILEVRKLGNSVRKLGKKFKKLENSVRKLGKSVSKKETNSDFGLTLKLGYLQGTKEKCLITVRES